MSPEGRGFADAIRALHEPGTVFEVRALNPKAGRPHTRAGYFDNAVTASAEATRLSGEFEGVYITLNPCAPALLARASNRIKESGRGEATTDADIVSRRWLLVDVDPVRPHGVSATDREKEAAASVARAVVLDLANRGWPAPLKADSGNGYHALYRIDLPNDDGSREVVKRVLAALAPKHDTAGAKVDLSVSNAARLVKLYGTLAAKGDSTSDRPHRASAILSVPEPLGVVAREQLEELAGEVASDGSSARAKERAQRSSAGMFNVEEWFARHGVTVLRTFEKGGATYFAVACPFGEGHGERDESTVICLASSALVYKCHHSSCTGRTWQDFRQHYEPCRERRRQSCQEDGRKAQERPAYSPVIGPTFEAQPKALAVFQPFPLAVLPESLRRFVRDGAATIGCDPAYVALPLLPALASAIGNTHRIQLKRGWTEPAIIWATVVGESGTAKSPAQELALRPIRDRQHEALSRHRDELAAYEREKLAYERAIAAWKRKGKEVDPPEIPEEPLAERCWTDDTTTEALAVLLLKNPRGILVARDELSGWFDFDRYSGRGSDAARWLEMFGGRPLIVDRKGGGNLYVPRASVSIAGGIQPRVLNRVLGEQHRENGLLARMLVAHPPRRAKCWSEADISKDVEDDLSLVFDGLFSLTAEKAEDGSERPRLVRLDPQAREAWIAWYNEQAREQCDLTGDLAAAWSKLEGYAARLALVLHLARWVASAGSGAGIQPGVVGVDSVEAGITLSRWFGAEAERAYSILAEDRESRDRRMLVEWIERRSGTVSVRDLTHNLQAFRGRSEAAEDALADLVAAGLGRWLDLDPGPQGGRPTRVLRLTTTDTATKTPENAGSPGVSVLVSPMWGPDDEDVIAPPPEVP